MREFTANRDADTPDDIWLLQHPATFTQKLNGKAEHLLESGAIPLIQVDRGAPRGQLIASGPIVRSSYHVELHSRGEPVS
jgi:lipoyl(octanoyl) transferase